jgi:hypothetical protein
MYVPIKFFLSNYRMLQDKLNMNSSWFYQSCQPCCISCWANPPPNHMSLSYPLGTTTGGRRHKCCTDCMLRDKLKMNSSWFFQSCRPCCISCWANPPPNHMSLSYPLGITTGGRQHKCCTDCMRRDMLKLNSSWFYQSCRACCISCWANPPPNHMSLSYPLGTTTGGRQHKYYTDCMLRDKLNVHSSWSFQSYQPCCISRWAKPPPNHMLCEHLGTATGDRQHNRRIQIL